MDGVKTLPDWPWDFGDPTAPLTLGWHAAAWCEGPDAWGYDFPGMPEGWRGLTQPNGPRAGQPFRLTKDQEHFLLWWYAIDERGEWLFYHGARRLAKGSGKSPFAAVMALIEFLAPVRFGGLDASPLRVVGRPADLPLVQIAATAESQTANTMRMVRAFAPRGGHVAEFHDLDVGKTRYYRQPEGTLEVITSSSTAAEGSEASFIVADETEHWLPNNGGVELAAVLEDNLAKSGSRLLETSNAWVPGRGSVAQSTWDAYELQEEGRLKGSRRILYDARMAPPGTDMGDVQALREALWWVYGDCNWKIREGDDQPDVEPIIERILSPRARPDDSQRKYLNWPVVAEDAWVDPEDWVQMTAADRVVSDGEAVVLGFDGSKSQDATALIGCCVSDGHVFVVGAWEPSKDEEVSAAAVDLAVRRAFERWDVQGFFADVREWESFTKVSWPDEFGDSLQVSAVPSGKAPQLIAWDMRSKVFEFTAAAELTEAEIVGHEFTHDGSGVLARHVANARRHPNRYGVSIGKEAPDSPRKVDAAVAMVIARHVRRMLLAAPEKKGKRAGRVRGVGRR